MISLYETQSKFYSNWNIFLLRSQGKNYNCTNRINLSQCGVSVHSLWCINWNNSLACLEGCPKNDTKWHNTRRRKYKVFSSEIVIVQYISLEDYIPRCHEYTLPFTISWHWKGSLTDFVLVVTNRKPGHTLFILDVVSLSLSLWTVVIFLLIHFQSFKKLWLWLIGKSL